MGALLSGATAFQPVRRYRKFFETPWAHPLAAGVRVRVAVALALALAVPLAVALAAAVVPGH